MFHNYVSNNNLFNDDPQWSLVAHYCKSKNTTILWNKKKLLVFAVNSECQNTIVSFLISRSYLRILHCPLFCLWVNLNEPMEGMIKFDFSCAPRQEWQCCGWHVSVVTNPNFTLKTLWCCKVLQGFNNVCHQVKEDRKES